VGITLLGIFAGTLTTIAFLPQLVRVWRSKSAKDISLAWLVTFTAGVSLWLLYGLLLGQMPIIIANAVTLGLTLVILAFKLRYG
jgi:MtN3 and saliva related transmembrane protein